MAKIPGETITLKCVVKENKVIDLIKLTDAVLLAGNDMAETIHSVKGAGDEIDEWIERSEALKSFMRSRWWDVKDVGDSEG